MTASGAPTFWRRFTAISFVTLIFAGVITTVKSTQTPDHAQGQVVMSSPSRGVAGTNGTNGANGAAATIAVGTVTPLSPGSSPTVTNAGTSAAAIFNFGLVTGNTGATGATGATGPAGPAVIGSPNTRSFSAATAYQATDTTKPAFVTMSLTSTAALSISGGTTNTAGVFIGSTSGVATSGGTEVCRHGNSNTGTLTVGLNLSTISTTPCGFAIPTGWFWAFRVSSGTVTSVTGSDQSIG